MARRIKRKWLSIAEKPEATLITFECGHTGEFNQFYN